LEEIGHTVWAVLGQSVVTFIGSYLYSEGQRPEGQYVIFMIHKEVSQKIRIDFLNRVPGNQMSDHTFNAVNLILTRAAYKTSKLASHCGYSLPPFIMDKPRL
jgi:hypothetical protein